MDGASKGEDLDKGSIFEAFYLHLSHQRSVRGEQEVLIQDDLVLGTRWTANNIM